MKASSQIRRKPTAQTLTSVTKNDDTIEPKAKKQNGALLKPRITTRTIPTTKSDVKPRRGPTKATEPAKSVSLTELSRTKPPAKPDIKSKKVVPTKSAIITGPSKVSSNAPVPPRVRTQTRTLKPEEVTVLKYVAPVSAKIPSDQRKAPVSFEVEVKSTKSIDVTSTKPPVEEKSYERNNETDNEDQYESEFESYESDFECGSSSSSKHSDSDSTTSEPADSDQSSTLDNVKEEFTEEENRPTIEQKLDSGHYEIQIKKVQPQIESVTCSATSKSDDNQPDSDHVQKRPLISPDQLHRFLQRSCALVEMAINKKRKKSLPQSAVNSVNLKQINPLQNSVVSSVRCDLSSLHVFLTLHECQVLHQRERNEYSICIWDTRRFTEPQVVLSCWENVTCIEKVGPIVIAGTASGEYETWQRKGFLNKNAKLAPNAEKTPILSNKSCAIQNIVQNERELYRDRIHGDHQTQSPSTTLNDLDLHKPSSEGIEMGSMMHHGQIVFLKHVSPRYRSLFFLDHARILCVDRENAVTLIDMKNKTEIKLNERTASELRRYRLLGMTHNQAMWGNVVQFYWRFYTNLDFDSERKEVRIFMFTLWTVESERSAWKCECG
ncbi:conserved hypothetical protein [Culex quinquefasciatus]|uniref:Uncharacterized protein n=1 Tax=Culex quinquefasciatus TaxID=7176 RepID=B0X191_CULQU|nr:conserved hypothetical protein [Culex quinquefasciatus]|eukprot:XP_001863413.1 conserved hypothetical protein [Culex quinquefasciatus]